MAAVALNPGCDTPSEAPPPRRPHPLAQGPAASTGASSEGVSTSTPPGAGGHGPGPQPVAQPPGPPDLRGCSKPSGLENNPAGHLLNSMMQLFQEPNDGTPCSFWVGSQASSAGVVATRLLGPTARWLQDMTCRCRALEWPRKDRAGGACSVGCCPGSICVCWLLGDSGRSRPPRALQQVDK